MPDFLYILNIVQYTKRDNDDIFGIGTKERASRKSKGLPEVSNNNIWCGVCGLCK